MPRMKKMEHSTTIPEKTRSVKVWLFHVACSSMLFPSVTCLHEIFQDVDRQREDDGAVLLHTDFRQRLQISQLKSDRLLCNLFCRIRQHFRGFKLALRVNDLSALLAFGFGLPGHGSLHVFRQIHALYLDQRYFDAPWIRMLVQDLLQP